MEQYMKATATPFVHHALKDTILKIMESKQSCEVKSFSLLHSDASAVSCYTLYTTMSELLYSFASS